MRLLLLFLITLSASCKVVLLESKETRIRTLTIDLASVEVAENLRVIPATFETISETFIIVDEVQEDGFYTVQEKSRKVKDAYTSIELSPDLSSINYNDKLLLKYRDCKEVHHDVQLKNYNSYHLCVSCEDENAVSFKEVKKAIGRSQTEANQEYSKVLTRQKLHNNAKIQAIYPNNNSSITVQGTKAQLDKLLTHPMLKGVKYKIK